MTTVEILKAAKELISVPERWTQGYVAKDSKGKFVSAMDSQAVCWCGVGAIIKVQDKPESSPASELLHDTVVKLDGMPFGSYNDSHSHIEVLSKFDEAIALAEEEERAQV